jgi:hypothetical protein
VGHRVQATTRQAAAVLWMDAAEDRLEAWDFPLHCASAVVGNSPMIEPDFKALLDAHVELVRSCRDEAMLDLLDRQLQLQLRLQLEHPTPFPK